MAGQGRNGWKIFGIIIIIAVIVLVAFLIGRGCERKKDKDKTTTTTSTTRTTGQQDSQPASSGGAAADDQPADGGAVETVPADSGDQMPEVVSSKDTVGPCIGGFREVTHTTTYSDGTSASSISREPCVEEEEPPIQPVP